MYTITLARAQNELFWATRLHSTRGCVEDNIHAVLETLDGLKAGKIKHIGLSNENPWGSCVFWKKANTII
jgi:aryl-alcohol dehydrogenase-like predicted oxidoreductase